MGWDWDWDWFGIGMGMGFGIWNGMGWDRIWDFEWVAGWAKIILILAEFIMLAKFS
jgi:hypothetical protein